MRRETREQRWARDDAELEAEGRWHNERIAMREMPPIWLGIGTCLPPELEEPFNALYESLDDVPHGTMRALVAEHAWPMLDPYRDVWEADNQRRYGKRKTPAHYRILTSLSIHRARALRNGLASTLDATSWAEVLDAHSHRCAYCLSGECITIDHVISIHAGGPNTPENVVPACRACNTSKNKRDLTAWCKRRGFNADAVFARIDWAQQRRLNARRAA